MKYAVEHAIPKIDATQITAGMPVYTDDMAPAHCLTVKILRSPHAFAKITNIDKSLALKVPGVVCVLSYEDVPHIRHTYGGLTYVFAAPCDRLIVDDTVRYVGDVVAVVAAETEKAAQRALKLVKVEYHVMEPVFHPGEALGHQPAIHAEPDYFAEKELAGQVDKNLLASYSMGEGDIEDAFAQCHCVIEDSFHTIANSQAMMETFRSYSYLDQNGKLAVVTSTQIPFLARRTIANSLGLPFGQVRVIKPKVGGGFGAKQSVVSESLCALVTNKTGRPAKLVFSRTESFIGSNSRHEKFITVKMGADENGVIKAVSMYTLSNAGAYGEQSFATALLSGTIPLSLFGKTQAYRFNFDVAYTNTMAGGAFRGYGATQGFFATESMANRMAAELGIDPCALRQKNIPQPGDCMPAYSGEYLTSSALDRCIETGKKMIGWEEKFPRTNIGNNRVRAVGMAIAMQTSGVSGDDKACARITLTEDGNYTVAGGAGEMGTGCDTILAQISAESMQCPISKIHVAEIDTDTSPYDQGSFASRTTYVSGNAMMKACRQLADMIIGEGARALGLPESILCFDGQYVRTAHGDDQKISLEEIARRQVMVTDCPWFTATGSHCSSTSPPPLMAGFVEIELDKATGQVKVTDYVAVVDCGTVINPALATVQTQGGIAQGIGMALYEDIHYNQNGKMTNSNFLQYKIPTRLDLPPIRVAFESSYEPTGPYGAKSIGEVVINTPCPAIQHAIYNASGVWLTDLPMTPEKIQSALS